MPGVPLNLLNINNGQPRLFIRLKKWPKSRLWLCLANLVGLRRYNLLEVLLTDPLIPVAPQLILVPVGVLRDVREVGCSPELVSMVLAA